MEVRIQLFCLLRGILLPEVFREVPLMSWTFQKKNLLNSCYTFILDAIAVTTSKEKISKEKISKEKISRETR
jgi:hypothetical protein